MAFAEKKLRPAAPGFDRGRLAVSLDVNLELAKYLNNRGVKKLNFKPQEEIKDPFGIQGEVDSGGISGKVESGTGVSPCLILRSIKRNPSIGRVFIPPLHLLEALNFSIVTVF